MSETDWYEKHKTDVAVALKRGKTATKDGAIHCTLVRMKDGTDLLCAHVSLSKAGAMVKEARAAKAKVLSAGQLYAGDDGVVFEVSEGSLAVKAQFSKASAVALGAPMNVIIVAAETPAAPAPEAAHADAMAPLRAALAQLIPAIQQAVKTHPDRKNDLLAPLTHCQQQIKDNMPAEAKANLLEIGHILKTIAPAGASPAAAEKDEFQEMYAGLLETVPGDLKRLRAVDPAAADKVQKVVDGAAAFASKGNFQAAFKYLSQAADVIAKSAGAGRVKEAASAIPEGTVAAMKAALAQAQTKWGAAVTAARARLKPVQAALQANLPNAAKGLSNVVDSYEQELLAELQAGQTKADENGLAAAVRVTLEKVQSLRAEAAGDEVFTYLEKCGVPVKAAFAEAFAEVEGVLQV